MAGTTLKFDQMGKSIFTEDENPGNCLPIGQSRAHLIPQTLVMNSPTQFKQGAGKRHIVSRTRCNISDESACYSVERMEANYKLMFTCNVAHFPFYYFPKFHF